MFDITDLYEDDGFNNLLVMMANKKQIKDFDDFRQDVFLEILDCDYSDMEHFKRAANRVSQRYGDRTQCIDIMGFSCEDDNGNPETDNEIMDRLVYSGRGNYIK